MLRAIARLGLLGFLSLSALLTGGSAPSRAAAALARATPAGQWRGVVPGEEDSLEVVLDIDSLAGEGWVGELDLPAHDSFDYPVIVTVADTGLFLRFPTDDATFAGRLSADGATLSGTGRHGDREFPLVLHRVAAPHLSKGLLGFLAAADDSTAVRRLSPDAAELRDDFNAAADHARLILLLSPT